MTRNSQGSSNSDRRRFLRVYASWMGQIWEGILSGYRDMPITRHRFVRQVAIMRAYSTLTRVSVAEKLALPARIATHARRRTITGR